MTDKQPEALRVAAWLITAPQSTTMGDMLIAGRELRRLHARVVELEAHLVKEAGRTAEQKLRADQMEQRHKTQAALNSEARNQLSALTAQIEAIGAGGVESLRKKEST